MSPLTCQVTKASVQASLTGSMRIEVVSVRRGKVVIRTEDGGTRTLRRGDTIEIDMTLTETHSRNLG